MRDVVFQVPLIIPNANNAAPAQINLRCRQLCCPISIFHRVLGIGIAITGGGIGFTVHSMQLSNKESEINNISNEILTLLGVFITAVGAITITASTCYEVYQQRARRNLPIHG